MRRRALLLVVVCSGLACKRGLDEGPKSVSDQSDIPVQDEGEPPVSLETCYAGIAFYGTSEADLAAAPTCDRAAEGCMDPQPVLVRRGSPDQATIIEEWVEAATESSYPVASVHKMTISGASFALSVTEHLNPLGSQSEQKQLEWTGTGELTGAPGQWTAWTSEQGRRPAALVVTARLEGDTLHRDTAFTMPNGSIVLRRHDELHEFSCSEWDARSAATLSAPAPR